MLIDVFVIRCIPTHTYYVLNQGSNLKCWMSVILLIKQMKLVANEYIIKPCWYQDIKQVKQPRYIYITPGWEKQTCREDRG